MTKNKLLFFYQTKQSYGKVHEKNKIIFSTSHHSIKIEFYISTKWIHYQYKSQLALNKDDLQKKSITIPINNGQYTN